LGFKLVAGQPGSFAPCLQGNWRHSKLESNAGSTMPLLPALHMSPHLVHVLYPAQCVHGMMGLPHAMTESCTTTEQHLELCA